MLRFTLALLLLLSRAQEPAQRIDAVLAAELEVGRLPGAAVAIARDGKVVHSKGYGRARIEGDVPARAETVFRIGSITKQFTAAAILLLRDDGKLSVDDPLSKFLPDYPRGKEITVRHLLNHTSGIKSYTGLKEWRGIMAEDRSPAQMIALFRDLPMEFSPGEKYAYNNSAYFLLGAIVEKASGTTAADFLKKRIFDPLEMKDTFLDAPGLEAKNRAAGYKAADKAFREADPISMTQPGGAGAMISTVSDLLRWDDALHSGRVLKRESLEEMLTPAMLKDGKSTNYGYGIAVGGQGKARLISHGGGINGFVSWLSRSPETGLTVAVLVNRDGYDARGLAMKALKAYTGD